MVLTKAYTAYKRNDQTSAVSVLLEKRDKPESLLFESGAVAELAPWETETIKKDYTKVTSAYGCLGVLRLSLREDDSYLYLVLVTACRSVGKIKGSEISCINSTVLVSLGNYDEVVGIQEVQKLLNSGSFYFTTLSEKQQNITDLPLDLSLSYQRQCSTTEPDNRFFWNHSLHGHLQKFGVNCSEWLLNIMCGGIEVKTVYAGTKQAKAMVISRLSCERAGTRFNVRGVNDDGHVANFVETEQVIVLDDCVSSFVQTRGSVPVFWEQPGVQVGSHKVKLSRGFEATAPAFTRHISSLKAIYGDQILINLLGRKEGESYLSQAYQDQLKASTEHCNNTPLILFDYHVLCKGGKKDKLEILKKKIEPYLNAFGVFVQKDNTIISQQSGTLRTNCLDCLDRTNALQSFIGLEVLPTQLSHLGLADKSSLVSRFVECFKTMWASNGHLVSRTYTGTGAMEGGARFGSKLHDGAVSVRRTIKNNFFDGSKQEAIDILLLGNTFVGDLGHRARALLISKFLHASPGILRELCCRHLEYTKWQSIRVCVGTFNVNGGHHFRSIAYKHQSLDDWLVDFHIRQPEGCVQSNTDFTIPTDIFAIGFEELVDLKAGNIISTHAGQRLDWGDKLKKVISRHCDYVLLTCEQLVGVCLYVFVRSDMVHDIKDVAVDSVKTGLGGSAGNKGGVAIRFLLHSTSLCFVCSHFAAGQSNIQDRNNDYHDIVNKMEFPMGRTLIPHDYVFWCGDFNYRIDLPMDDVKKAIKQQNYELLQAEDQLTKSRQENKCFRGFSEGKLTFPPTYKYDPFSDDYDTSEKMRIPAWTDRVLWRRRHPHSKHAVQPIGHTSTNVLVDLNEENIMDDSSSDSEDDDDEDNNENKKPIGRKKSFYISEDNTKWSPGKLLYYHSAQLKTSDHRPVVALIEVDIQSLDKEKETSVHDDVIQSMGPADPTVVICCKNEHEEINAETLLAQLENYGNLVLIRVIDEEFLITFDDGRSALKALALDNTEIDNVVISVKLKSGSLLSNTDITVGNIVERDEAMFPIISNDQSQHRTLSDILDMSNDHTTNHSTILEPIKIHSAEDGDSDSGDSDNGSLEEEPTLPPVDQHKPPKPTRPERPKEMPPIKHPRPVSPHEMSPTQEVVPDRLCAPSGGGGSKPISPSRQRKVPPCRPERPTPINGDITKKEPARLQIAASEKSPVLGRGLRPPPPRPGRPPGRPPAPSIKTQEKGNIAIVDETGKKEQLSRPPPPASITKPSIKEQQDQMKGCQKSGDLLTEVKKQEHKVVNKVKDEEEHSSFRKRLASLKKIRKTQSPQQEPVPTLSIGTPFDVKHVSHVDATNVQALLQTNIPKAPSPTTTSDHINHLPDHSPPTPAGTSIPDKPVPMTRTMSSTSRQPVPVPRKRSTKDNEQPPPTPNSSGEMVHPQIAPRLPPRPDNQTPEPPNIEQKPVPPERTAPSIPPREDLGDPSDCSRPIPPPRKTRK